MGEIISFGIPCQMYLAALLVSFCLVGLILDSYWSIVPVQYDFLAW
jgi:hypothetical protein